MRIRAKVRTHRRVLGPAVADDAVRPELGRHVGHFDGHVERLWNGHTGNSVQM